jgi:TM2 domain-containing membrane protein YozV
MYCKNCGKEVEDGKDLCANCAPAENVVVEEVKKEEEKQEQKQENTSNQENNFNAKSKLAAGLFGIFLGGFGIHNFYLGFTGKAVAQLLMTVLSCGILSPVSAIWGLIEGILILSGDANYDADGRPLKD